MSSKDLRKAEVSGFYNGASYSLKIMRKMGKGDSSTTDEEIHELVLMQISKFPLFNTPLCKKSVQEFLTELN